MNNLRREQETNLMILMSDLLQIQERLSGAIERARRLQEDMNRQPRLRAVEKRKR